MSKHLHIVCLDVPYPPDYGGAIDMFYKIEALHKQGVKIHLHYFSYNERAKPDELNRYCESVNIYERKTGYQGLSLEVPYIVSSRINRQLIDNLKKDNHPVLLEGIHCCGILNYISNSKRKIIVRLHNDESAYYHQLAKSELSLTKKIYFWHESRLLHKYQQQLLQNIIYACISRADVSAFHHTYQLQNIDYLPAFIANQQVTCKEGIGNFCLYHGNLSIADNEKTVAWLLQQVFSKINTPLVIAGKNPSKKLIKLAGLYPHVRIKANPSAEEINRLIEEAQISVLTSYNPTGVKLKLLQSLFAGRHCVINDMMATGSGVNELCHIANRADEIISMINQLYTQPFTQTQIEKRKELLSRLYNNAANARKIIEWIL